MVFRSAHLLAHLTYGCRVNEDPEFDTQVDNFCHHLVTDVVSDGLLLLTGEKSCGKGSQSD